MSELEQANSVPGWCSATLPNGTRCSQDFPCTRHPVVCRHCGEPVTHHPTRAGRWWHVPEGWSKCDGYNVCTRYGTVENPGIKYQLAEPNS